MYFVSSSKYKELEKTIRNKDFPIIVYGPSGTGKTYAIKDILSKLNRKFREVDISVDTVKRPIDHEMVLLTHLYAIDDLKRLIYKGNIIIETNIHYAHKLEGFKVIKFGRSTARTMKNRSPKEGPYACASNIEQNDLRSVDLYRFLGKIFYRKLSIRKIELDDRCICMRMFKSPETAHDPLLHPLVGHDKNPVFKKEKIKNDKYIIGKKGVKNNDDIIRRSINNRNHKKGNRCTIYTSDESGDELLLELPRRCKRKLLVESETDSSSSNQLKKTAQEIDIFSKIVDRSCSFSDDDIILSSEDHEPHGARQGCLKTDVNIKSISSSLDRREYDNGDLCKWDSEVFVSFHKDKILSYLYENAPEFADLPTLIKFTDCISLCILDDLNILSLIQCILENAQKPKRRYSFRSANLEIFQ